MPAFPLIRSSNVYPTTLDSQKKEKNSWFDRIEQYFSTTDGASNFIEVLINGTQFFEKLPLSEKNKLKAQYFRGAAETGWSILTFPALPGDINRFCKALISLKKATKLDFTGTKKQQEVKKAAKNTLVEGANLAYSISLGSTYLHDIKVVDLRSSLPLANGIYYLSCFITDGVDFADEVNKIKEQTAMKKQAKTPRELETIRSNLILTKWKLVKTIISVALSIFGVLSLTFTALTIGGIFPTVALICSSAYVIIKISNYFFEQHLKEKNCLYTQPT